MEKLNAWLNTQKDILSDRDYGLVKKASSILIDNISCGPEYPWFPFKLINPLKWPAGDPRLGVWNWDSAFHAVGVSYWDIDLAKEQILGFIQYQLDNGMFIDVKRGNGLTEDISSKPPVLAWAAAKVYEKCKDPYFVEYVYTRLAKNEEFWCKDRFYNGMFHYGADMTKVRFEELDLYVRWESGWDDSVRWDSPCSDYWPIDLNCYMIMTYRGLAVLARALGKETDALVYEEKEKILAENVNKYLWNDELKTYTDTNRFDRNPSHIMTPASFMPLYIGISTQERASYMAHFAADKNKLYPGMPTVSYDDPEYSQTYWRGNTWLNVAYFAAKGLKDYGFTDIAQGIRDTILTWVENDKDSIHENYDSTTGQGIYGSNFSWSCVFVLEFILNF